MATDITRAVFGTSEELYNYLDANNVNATNVVSIVFDNQRSQYVLFHT